MNFENVIAHSTLLLTMDTFFSIFKIFSTKYALSLALIQLGFFEILMQELRKILLPVFLNASLFSHKNLLNHAFLGCFQGTFFDQLLPCICDEIFSIILTLSRWLLLNHFKLNVNNWIFLVIFLATQIWWPQHCRTSCKMRYDSLCNDWETHNPISTLFVSIPDEEKKLT